MPTRLLFWRQWGRCFGDNLVEEPLVQLALVAVVGLGAQLLAWHLRLPSILLLLLSGFLLGPVFGLIAPGTLLGEALFPLVALSVGIILFEGGLTLKVKEPVSYTHLDVYKRQVPGTAPARLRQVPVAALRASTDYTYFTDSF